MQLSNTEILVLSDALVYYRMKQEKGLKKLNEDLTPSKAKDSFVKRREESIQRTIELKQKIVKNYRTK